MRVIVPLVLTFIALSLLPSIEMKRPGKGRGLKGTRQKLTQDRLALKSFHAPAEEKQTHSMELLPPCFIMRLMCRVKEEGFAASEQIWPFWTCNAKLFRDDTIRWTLRGLSGPKSHFYPPSSAWSGVPKHLLLARNQIKVLRDGSFLGYKRLTSLDLQQNQISRIEEGAFQGLTHLTTLLLQHNQLRTLSEETLHPMPNLHYLRLYNNPWKCLCPMEGLIRTLQVPSNRNLGSHAKCAEPISRKNRKLKEIDPESLCTESNQIGDLNGNMTHPIEPSPIRGKSDATTLCHTYIFPRTWMDCRNRGLTEVPSGIPEDVVQVDLSHNSIHHLKPRDFQGAKSLRNLNLSYNNMERIDTGSLSGLLHLHELDLSSNGLRFVQYGVLEDLYFLSKLKLEENPWVCDYNIHYMAYWLRLHPGVKHSGLLCQSPLEYMGDRVEDYMHSYNRECPKERQLSGPDQNQRDAELWGTPMELQGEVEEELEPSHLRASQKYQIFKLA